MSFLFLVAGIFFIFAEIFLPRIVLGVLGLCLMLISFYLFATTSDSPFKTALFMGLGIGAFIIAVRAALSYFQKEELHCDHEAPTYDKLQIGKRAIAVTDLNPGGSIAIEGKRFQALSTSGAIAAGAHVTVLCGEGGSLVVKLDD